MISSLNLRVSWKPVNPQECVWKKLYRNIIRTMSQEEGTIHYNITIWYTNLFLCLKQWRYPAAKAAVDKEWEKLEKILAWNLTKVRSKKEVIDEARTKGAKVHFASLMDICHLKNAELETKHQKNKGRVVLRGDIVKDDSGSYAVFTEQGSSASQITAAKVMDIISRLPGCSGQAADAVSGLYPGQNGRCSKIIENFKIGMSRYLDTSTENTNGPNHGQVLKTQWFFLSEICTVILLQDYCGKGNSRKFYWSTVWRKFQIGNIFRKQRKRAFLVCVCGRFKNWLGRKIDRMWKVLMEDVDLSEPTSSLDHVYLGCAQRKCQTSKDIVDNCRNMFEFQISAGATEKLPHSEKLGANISSWSYDIEGHGKKCVERHCELANRTTQQLYEVPTPCMDDHQFKEKGMGFVGELSKVCSKIVLKCLYLARIELVTNVWHVWSLTVNTRVNSNNIVMWETLHNNAGWDLLHDSDVAADLEDSKSSSGGLLYIFRSHTISSNKLDVQETNINVTQLNRSRDCFNFSWCRFTQWMEFPLLISGIWILNCSILPLTNWKDPKKEYTETCCVTHHQTSTLQTKPNQTKPRL